MYVWRGDPAKSEAARPGTGPGSGRYIPNSSEARAARFARFCELREATPEVNVRDAAADPAVNIQPKTARDYEKRRKATREQRLAAAREAARG